MLWDYFLVNILENAANRTIPIMPPTLSATASINSDARPSDGKAPCKISIRLPKAMAMIKTVASLAILSVGPAHSQKKVKPPKKAKCTHLSTRGTSTLGTFLEGIKHPNKISKVHRIAMNLACLL